MSTPADDTTRPSEPRSVPSVPETSYLSRPGGRIGYDVAGDGSQVGLVPGMGDDLRAGYRFLHRPGYAKAFSRATRTSRGSAACPVN